MDKRGIPARGGQCVNNGDPGVAATGETPVVPVGRVEDATLWEGRNLLRPHGESGAGGGMAGATSCAPPGGGAPVGELYRN